MINLISRCNCRKKKQRVRRPTVFHSTKELGILIKDDMSDQFFFDAVAEELADDEYPIITTSHLPPAKVVSMEDPETLLRDVDPEDINTTRSVPAASTAIVAGPTSLTESTKSLPTRPKISKRQSTLRRLFARRDTMQATQALEKPKTVILERGYPGQLTMEELAICQSFYRSLKEKPVLAEIVYNLREVEEEPYSLCRFLRGNKFDLERCLQRLNDMVPAWNTAKENDFYPNLAERWNVPLSAFFKYFPETRFGNARNKCPVTYLQAGKMDSTSMLSILTIEQSEEYFWHSFMRSFRESLLKSKEGDAFIRCESISIMDLKGITRSQLTSEATECMKIAGKVGDYFPETLHSMLILNAPSWFAMSWSIIKGFIDPRTAKRIEVHSSTEKGRARLFELVDPSEVPSDFGGTADSIQTIIQNKDSSNVKWMIKELSLKPKSKGTVVMEIAENENLSSIQIYTRSCSSATVTTRVGDEVLQTTNIEKVTSPSTTTLEVDTTSSSSVTLEFQDQNDATEKKLARGYYVIVGRIVTE